MGKCLFMRKGETHTAPISGILASDLAVGSSVYLMEDGVATEYLVVNQGKPSGSSLYDDSCDGTWLLRKDIKEYRLWASSSIGNDYQNSEIHSWLNGYFFNLLGVDEQASIKSVKIPYVTGTGNSDVASGSNGLSTKVFLLSGYEVGWTQSTNSAFSKDGDCVSYFVGTSSTDAKRIANFNGSVATWSLRSNVNNDTKIVWVVNSNGNYDRVTCYGTCGIRPAIVIPSNALFDTNTLILKGVK